MWLRIWEEMCAVLYKARVLLSQLGADFHLF